MSTPSGGTQRRVSSSRRSDDSRDEEQYTGELMGKWLSDLPPTMPFHRGQVRGAGQSKALLFCTVQVRDADGAAGLPLVAASVPRVLARCSSFRSRRINNI
jgi:hypothetical protein